MGSTAKVTTAMTTTIGTEIAGITSASFYGSWLRCRFYNQHRDDARTTSANFLGAHDGKTGSIDGGTDDAVAGCFSTGISFSDTIIQSRWRSFPSARRKIDRNLLSPGHAQPIAHMDALGVGTSSSVPSSDTACGLRRKPKGCG